MADNENEVVYMRVHVHYNGVFVRHPSGYVGGSHFLFTDVDWADIGYEYEEISIYVDRNGNGLEEWWDDDMNLVVSEDESGLEDEGGARNEGNIVSDGTHPNVGLEDEVIDHDNTPLNKTSGDDFLNKLCHSKGYTGDDEVEKEDVEIHPFSTLFCNGIGKYLF
ncbi:unnamed protein product [Lactuca virosa]|uniref:Uncharacterized protein n=1 Tax=Lactuca virosa TaxID=75947 RepID=A0AAU9MV04_9ASTR|nr:unnamed protein product [Lactuca virosa]